MACTAEQRGDAVKISTEAHVEWSAMLDINAEEEIISRLLYWQNNLIGHSIEIGSKSTQQWQLPPERRNQYKPTPNFIRNAHHLKAKG